MQIERKRPQPETEITLAFVTHDQEEALTTSDRIAVMNAGTIRQVGTADDIYIHPKNRFVTGFVGKTFSCAARPKPAPCACPQAGG
jgi:spermidine/putrescine transport system ATP-binding protein